MKKSVLKHLLGSFPSHGRIWGHCHCGQLHHTKTRAHKRDRHTHSQKSLVFFFKTQKLYTCHKRGRHAHLKVPGKKYT